MDAVPTIITNKPKSREIRGRIGGFEIVNEELLCEITGEWFNSVECEYVIEKAATTIRLPSGTEYIYSN